MNDRYCLIRDDCGHWYLCPIDKREQAIDTFDRLEAGEDIAEPDYVQMIEPHRLTFTDPQEG